MYLFFQNSSQLQFINLSGNSIASLPPNVFLGSLRLHLDLSHNLMEEFPPGIFSRPLKVMQLQSLDVSHNRFRELPVNVLDDQVRMF